MKILFAGGGTAGHINPAIAVANYARNEIKDAKILFIGTEQGLETRLVPKAGYDIKYIEIEGFKRKKIFANIGVLYKLFKASGETKKILKEFKPDVVLTTGGYVSGPVVTAAHKLKIPVFIHEQNVYPGLTVKVAQKYVDKVLISFDETKDYIKVTNKCIVTGNPIRPELSVANYNISRKKLGLGDKPFVLVYGGSLGAEKINSTMQKVLEYVNRDGLFDIMLGTGERGYEKFIQSIEDKSILSNENIKIMPYIHNMHEVMSASDVVVARSGAITVSELAVLNKPCILIPSPNVVRNHQEQNARMLEKETGAIVITEDKLTAEALYDEIKAMVQNKEARIKISSEMKKVAKSDATKQIFDIMIKAIRK